MGEDRRAWREVAVKGGAATVRAVFDQQRERKGGSRLDVPRGGERDGGPGGVATWCGAR
jgi:hypothetical protein